MIRRLTLLAALAAILALAACTTGDQETPRLTTLEEGLQQACYAMGVDLGRQVAGMPEASNHALLSQGIKEFLADESKLSFEEAREVVSVHAHDHGEGEVHDHPDTWTARGFADETAQRSYGVGVTIGQFVKAQIPEADVTALLQGLNDKLGNAAAEAEGKDAPIELLVVEEETREIITKFQQERAEKLAVENQAEGEKFLAENAKRDGVEVTDTGLQYEVLTKGENTEHPTLESTVKVHYHGTLISGDVFDSSVDRGEPISFPLGRVIDGWKEGVQLMTVGDKFRLFVPGDLAYGPRGAGGQIGPNATLIFDVELLEIQ